MKKLVSISFLVLLLSSFLIGKNTNPTDFTLYATTDSSKFVLSENKGKYVVLHFLLKTECPICIRHTNDYSNKANTLLDVVQVFVKPDALEEVKQWTNKIPDKTWAAFPIYRDPNATLAKAFKVKDGYYFHGEDMHYPALIILDPTGKEVFRYTGANNTDRYSFDQLVLKIRELRVGEVK